MSLKSNSTIRSLVAAQFAIVLTACSAVPESGTGTDAGHTTDSGSVVDMSTPVQDGSIVDARTDATATDAGRDSGTDSGVVDAGRADLGTDLGVADAGRDAAVDASTDAGSPDAGIDASVDAAVDAGLDASAVDAGGSTVRLGMTFGVTDDPERPSGTAIMECYGSPPTVSMGSFTGPGCGPYTGDTPCDTALPILCINVDGSPEPGTGFSYGSYRGWVMGVLASSSPQVGTSLTSRDVANEICASEFGPGFRMAEFHDGGGWGLVGYEYTIDRSQRNWVVIADQNANCWN